MNIYLIIYLTLGVLNLGMHLAKHGEPKETKYNFWYTLIAFIIVLFVLYKAGLPFNF